MKEIYFKVTLLSDVVLNSSLATEGNMTTLDYIPGSNFLGMAAGKLYEKLPLSESYLLFHSGKVRFGDATISIENMISYPFPNMLFMDKIKKNIGTDPIYLDYLIDRKNPPKDENGNGHQLKQMRGGYVLSNGNVIKELNKSFAIKSAQDRNTRTSKDGQMFGFESLNKGLDFVFSIQFDDDSMIETVTKVIEGKHRLGKSRNAEFGQINVEKLDIQPKPIENFKSDNLVLIYAQSNLCFLDKFGMPTFQPDAEQLGLNADAKINWEKSQIRTHTYSPWNFKRNTTNTQRDCIAKGSVFYIENVSITEATNTIGLHQSDGLGKVIYNPIFLQGNTKDAKSTFGFKEYKKVEGDIKPQTTESFTILSKFLAGKLKEKNHDKEISKAVQQLVYSNTKEIESLIKITSSQWGDIRAYATKETDMQKLSLKLFGKSNLADANEKRDEKFGYLTHGVADEKYWGKNRAANRIALENIFTTNLKYGSQFIAKFAAEMAKESRKLDKSKKHE